MFEYDTAAVDVALTAVNEGIAVRDRPLVVYRSEDKRARVIVVFEECYSAIRSMV